LLVASKEIGLAVNADKTMDMVMSWDQNAGGSHNKKTVNRFFERMEQFKYLALTVMNQNSIRQIEVRECLLSFGAESFDSSLLPKNIKMKIYRTIILPVALYGCETWLLKLREEHRLRVFENRMLSRTFGSMRDEVTAEWRKKKQRKESNDLYSSQNIIWVIKLRIRWAGHVAHIGERVLVRKPKGKRALGRPKHRWENNIKIYLQEVELGGGGAWIRLIWLRIGTRGGHL
jgi:hypothetical protein